MAAVALAVLATTIVVAPVALASGTNPGELWDRYPLGGSHANDNASVPPPPAPTASRPTPSRRPGDGDKGAPASFLAPLLIALLAGGVLLVVAVRRRRRPAAAPPVPSTEPKLPPTRRFARAGDGNGNGNSHAHAQDAGDVLPGREITAVLAYLSVTGAERAQGVAGPVEQEALIREACGRHGWRLQGVLYDGPDALASGGERTAFEEAIERIDAGEVSCLIVSRLDRLSRSAVELGDVLQRLEEHDATLVALDFGIDTSTRTGSQISEVLAGMAAREREKIAAGTRTGLAAVRAQGRPISRPAVSDQPQLRERIRAMRDGGMTLQSIADRLNEEGVPTLRGGALWRPSSVQAAAGYKRPRQSGRSDAPLDGDSRYGRDDHAA